MTERKLTIAEQLGQAFTLGVQKAQSDADGPEKVDCWPIIRRLRIAASRLAIAQKQEDDMDCFSFQFEDESTLSIDMSGDDTIIFVGVPDLDEDDYEVVELKSQEKVQLH